MVLRQLPKLKIAGSIPVSRSKEGVMAYKKVTRQSYGSKY